MNINEWLNENWARLSDLVALYRENMELFREAEMSFDDFVTEIWIEME